MTEVVATANGPAEADDVLEQLIEAAQEHGEDSDPDHEVGDLQDLLRSLWAAAGPQARQAFLGGQAVQAAVETMREERQAKMPFIHGDWTHLFGPGKSETLVRFALDVRDQKIVAMQIKDGPHDDDWVDAYPAQIADVQDSVVNANGECLSSPEDFDLKRSYVLPKWARVQDKEGGDQVQGAAISTMLFAALRASHYVVCNGFEIDSQVYDEPGVVRLDCGDDVVAYISNQEVLINADGEVSLADEDGPLELSFKVSRPITAEDIGEVQSCERVMPDEQARVAERG